MAFHAKRKHLIEKKIIMEVTCVKSYEPLKLEVVILQRKDVICASEYDNVGGIPEDWED